LFKAPFNAGFAPIGFKNFKNLDAQSAQISMLATAGGCLTDSKRYMSFEKHYLCPDWSDISILCGNEVFPAHSLILCGLWHCD